MKLQARIAREELRSRLKAKEPLALAQLAKIRYEQAMSHVFIKDKADKFRYDLAIKWASKSIRLCQRAGDRYGVLAARGVAAGQLIYDWVKDVSVKKPSKEKVDRLLKKSKKILLKDLKEAQMHIELAPKKSSERERFLRVESNNAAHIMQVALLLGGKENKA